MRALFISPIAATLLVLSVGPVLAENGKGGYKVKNPLDHRTSDIVQVAGKKHCPPGLAKKQNGCNPPGLVKHRYRIGDRIGDDYIIIRRPGRYGLDPDESYYRVGDYVYRVDRETREVLDLIGAVAAVLD